jgi:hypothetical protein
LRRHKELIIIALMFLAVVTVDMFQDRTDSTKTVIFITKDNKTFRFKVNNSDLGSDGLDQKIEEIVNGTTKESTNLSRTKDK